MLFTSLKSKHQLAQLAVVTCIAFGFVFTGFLVKKQLEGGRGL